MMEKEKSLFVTIIVTILAAIIWAVFMLVYVVLWSSSFGWVQNLSIVVLSLFITVCFVGLMWFARLFKHPNQ